jgi:acyl carrier protein
MSFVLYAVGVLAVVAAAVAVVVRLSRRAERAERDWFRREMDRAFGDRTAAAAETLRRREFEEGGIAAEVAAELRGLLESTFDADFARIAPEDDFQKELGFLWQVDSLADAMIVTSLETRFRVRLPDDETNAARTFGDLVRLVARTVEEGRRNEARGPEAPDVRCSHPD